MNLLVGKSVTLRLTLLFATVSMAVLLLLGLVIGSLVERHFEELDTALLDGKLELVRHALESVRSDAELAELPVRLDESLVGHHGLGMAIWRANGEVLYATDEADFPDDWRRRPGGPGRGTHIWSGHDGRSFRGLSGQARLGIEGSEPLVVAVSTDLIHHQHFMASFNVALWMAVGLAALVCGLLGWFAARRGLAPLRDICRDAAGITATRLNRRLPVESIPPELAEVASTLNDMLARLEESFRRLSDFSSDIAHELRTPVSNLLTQTQVTLSKARTAEDYQEVLASNAEEFERLSRMIADMLFLAKSDNDLAVPYKESVDLRAEADGVLEFYEAVADENDIKLGIVGNAMVPGDRLMLRRAISNLISNAFHHTPPGGQISVRIADESEMVRLAIENTGETIAPQHLPRLFDRFYRADPSRQRLADGAGLGLAITRSIMRAHGGDVSVRSADGLTVFELRLSAAPGANGDTG